MLLRGLFSTILYLAIALVLTCLPSTLAFASGALRFGPAVSAPFGFVELCVREPRICQPVKPRRVAVLPSGAVTAEDGRLAELRSVDGAVNRTIRPRADPAVKGFADRWMLGVSVGDCEEYALAKRERLIDRGWPSSALLIAVGRLPDGRQHAVLLARVGREVWVLDNRRNGPTRFQRVAMQWLAVQSPERPDRWRRL